MSRHYHNLYERSLTDLWPHLPPTLDNSRIADLGCHDGVMSDILAATFPTSKVYGFGQSRQGMDCARSLTRDVSWVEMPPQGWADELRQIAPGGFDLLICQAGLLPQDSVTDIAGRFCAHIKTGGRLMVQVPVTLNGWVAALSGETAAGHDDLETYGELTKIFAENRFELKLWSSRYVQLFDDMTDLAELLMAQAVRVNLALTPTIEAVHAKLAGDAHVAATRDGRLCAALEHVFFVACRR